MKNKIRNVAELIVIYFVLGFIPLFDVFFWFSVTSLFAIISFVGLVSFAYQYTMDDRFQDLLRRCADIIEHIHNGLDILVKFGFFVFRGKSWREQYEASKEKSEAESESRIREMLLQPPEVSLQYHGALLLLCIVLTVFSHSRLMQAVSEHIAR